MQDRDTNYYSGRIPQRAITKDLNLKNDNEVSKMYYLSLFSKGKEK